MKVSNSARVFRDGSSDSATMMYNTRAVNSSWLLPCAWAMTAKAYERANSSTWTSAAWPALNGLASAQGGGTANSGFVPAGQQGSVRQGIVGTFVVMVVVTVPETAGASPSFVMLPARFKVIVPLT